MGASVHESATYQPSASLEMVTVLGRALNGTRPMDPNAHDLGENEDAVVYGGAIAILLEGEGVISIYALETRESSFLAPLDAAKESLVCPVESRQHVLKDMGVYGGVAGKVGADTLQFGFLLIA